MFWIHASEKKHGKSFNTGYSDVTSTIDDNKIQGGFSYIWITITDVYEICERFKLLNFKFHKTSNNGAMKGFEFINNIDASRMIIKSIHFSIK